MIFITIRASGPDFEVDDFLKTTGLKPARVWRKGEASRVGPPHEDSGFNLEFPDTETWAKALPLAHDYLQKNAAIFRKFQSMDTTVEMNVGITVGDDKSFSSTLEFPPGFMAELAGFGIVLNISAYPTPDKS